MLLNMKKGILLSLIAAILVGVVVYTMWYINKRSELANNSKDAFIPFNSALVVTINPKAVLSPKVQQVFAADIAQFHQQLLVRVADTLAAGGFIAPTSRILSMRAEGKGKVVSLWVMDNKDVLSHGEIVSYLQAAFKNQDKQVRKYDHYRIYSLKDGNEEVYYCLEEGMILLANSELYLEDALKQFDLQAESGTENTILKNVNKYFSAGVGINVFLNAGCFSDILPIYLDTDKLSSGLDLTKCFKWGAFDGDFSEKGLLLNGFVDHSGLAASFMKTLEGQQPRESGIDVIIPAHPASFFILNLTDLKTYLKNLDDYRYNAGFIENVRKQKQEYARSMGADAEVELRELLSGDFALVNTSFDVSGEKGEGLVIAGLKSGGLCKVWLEKVIGNDARYRSRHPENYRNTYRVDRDKSFTYYKFPAENMTGLYWGDVLGGLDNKYALVEDNYLVLASSEKVMTDYIRDYMRHNSVKETDWYKNIKMKLSARYNLAYFAETSLALPGYGYTAKGGWKDYVASNKDKLSAFSSLAFQWSNEGGMFYNTVFLSTDEIAGGSQPHVLWQTKLDAPVSMKPVPVDNHVTGEKEFLVQDDNSVLYLINDAGRVLWRQAVDAPVNSEIYQVDAFKNGKLQYLFSTPSRLYLIDRNGQHVSDFPVVFKSDCRQGISVYDYDKNRDYRIFAPCNDKNVYLYEVSGKQVKGWDCDRADKDFVTKVNHFRVDGKDYIVFADQYRLYILDRKGKERVRVSTVFDLRENTPFYLVKQEGKTGVAFGNADGQMNVVDFNGKVKRIPCGLLSSGYNVNVADINNDGKDEYVITDSNRLFVYDLSGKMLFEKELDVQSLDFPYVYRFSGNDTRVGLLDRVQHKMLLYSVKDGVSKGFPISGDSPFSIIFADNGDFYLFAGVDSGSMIKYRVQR